MLVPLHNEAENVAPLCASLHTSLAELGRSYEIILVDDGSTDDTRRLIETIAGEDPRVTAIALARNFGQTAALLAAIDHARGQVIVPLDGDLQNDPRDIGRLLAGCAQLFGPVGRAESSTIVARLDDLLALQREVAGAAYDEDAMRLGLLAGIAWLGWNKALDVVEHPDPVVRERERAALPWWLRQAELALETGLV